MGAHARAERDIQPHDRGQSAGGGRSAHNGRGEERSGTHLWRCSGGYRNNHSRVGAGGNRQSIITAYNLHHLLRQCFILLAIRSNRSSPSLIRQSTGHGKKSFLWLNSKRSKTSSSCASKEAMYTPQAGFRESIGVTPHLNLSTPSPVIATKRQRLCASALS